MDLQKQKDLPKALVDLDNLDLKTDNVPAKPDFVPGHKRSASAESFKSSNGDSSKKSDLSSASKENNFRPEHKSVSKLQSFSFGSNKQPVPVHLLSATNEQKIGSKNVQQIPSKLLSSGGSTSSLPSQAVLSAARGNQATPVATSTAHPGQGDHNSPLGHSASLSQLGSNPHGTTVTVPMGTWQSNRPKQSPGGSLSTSLLKLASDKGDKKSKGSSHKSDKEKEKEEKVTSPPNDKSQRPGSGNAGNRQGSSNHKPQKSDSDVIYF